MFGYRHPIKDLLLCSTKQRTWKNFDVRVNYPFNLCDSNSPLTYILCVDFFTLSLRGGRFLWLGEVMSLLAWMYDAVQCSWRVCSSALCTECCSSSFTAIFGRMNSPFTVLPLLATIHRNEWLATNIDVTHSCSEHHQRQDRQIMRFVHPYNLHASVAHFACRIIVKFSRPGWVWRRWLHDAVISSCCASRDGEMESVRCIWRPEKQRVLESSRQLTWVFCAVVIYLHLWAFFFF